MSGTDVVRTKPSLFEKGHAKMGGRQKGARNRFGGDLRESAAVARRPSNLARNPRSARLRAERPKRLGPRLSP
jgi:hypothetical protein